MAAFISLQDYGSDSAEEDNEIGDLKQRSNSENVEIVLRSKEAGNTVAKLLTCKVNAAPEVVSNVS